MHKLDQFLNNITMYKLVLSSLVVLLGFATILGFAGILPYSGLSILATALLLNLVALLTNYLFAKSFRAPSNIESTNITALILALVITPIQSVQAIPFVIWVAVLSIASKYILAYHNKHFFNPVAIALVITSFTLPQSASWWIGTAWMLPLVIITGSLITSKIRRWDLVAPFFLVALITSTSIGLVRGGNLLDVLENNLLSSPIIFFAFIMLTEPLSTPPTRKLRTLYGGIVGLLIPAQVNLFGIYSTPELALVLGNIFSYLVSPKQKLLLVLEDKLKLARDTYDFVFRGHTGFSYAPGQYLEWILDYKNPDSRGNRRYFTLASSPTEPNLRIGVKFNQNSSSFKSKLLNFAKGYAIYAGQLSGDFTLPKDPRTKLVFVAGGIGITPFRSMLKYLIDRGERRDITLFYLNSQVTDIAYQDFLTQAERVLGIKLVYVLTDKEHAPADWSGPLGYLSQELVREYLKDYKTRTFYLSGPNSMVHAYKSLLVKMGVSRSKIVTDYFPGF